MMKPNYARLTVPLTRAAFAFKPLPSHLEQPEDSTAPK
jgi:hypothetical protein